MRKEGSSAKLLTVTARLFFLVFVVSASLSLGRIFMADFPFRETLQAEVNRVLANQIAGL